MGRLTYKIKDGWVGVVNEQEDRTVSPTSIAIHKLCELEDVLEKYEIEDAKQLDNIINSIRTNTFIDIENKEILELENANLKSELAELKRKAIVPKFKRQEHICSFAFGEIREYIVVAYLDNDVTLCENFETSELEWCDNNYLVSTKEEAEQKLAEIKEINYDY